MSLVPLIPILFAIPFLLTLFLSNQPALGPFRQSALNPLLFVAAYIVLVALDFFAMGSRGAGTLVDRPILVSQSHMISLAGRHAAMLIAALAGVALGLLTAHKSIAPAANGAGNTRIRLFAVVVYLVLLSFWAWSVRSAFSTGISLENSLRLKEEAQGMTLTFTISLLLLPALCFALVRQPYKVAVPLIVFSLILLFFSGSRTRMLYVLIPAAFYFFRVRGIPMPRKYFVVAIAAGLVLAFASLNIRLASQGQNLQGTSMTEIFSSNDVAFSEINLLILRQPKGAISPYPFEDVVGFFAAGIPRSIVPFKPLNGSAQFTAIYDKFNWARFDRGLTVGGINELQGDYPLPIALVMSALLGFAWIYFFCRSANSPTIYGFVWTVGSYAMVYNFLKADLMSAGQMAFVFTLMTILVRLYQVFAPGIPITPPPRTMAAPARA